MTTEQFADLFFNEILDGVDTERFNLDWVDGGTSMIVHDETSGKTFLLTVTEAPEPPEDF